MIHLEYTVSLLLVIANNSFPTDIPAYSLLISFVLRIDVPTRRFNKNSTKRKPFFLLQQLYSLIIFIYLFTPEFYYKAHGLAISGGFWVIVTHAVQSEVGFLIA